PKIEEAKAKESEVRYRADITIKGSHFVRCGMMQYEICEYEKPKEVSKTRNDDPPPVEEAPPPDPHEEHCQRRLMEYALDWKSEQEFIIQSRYKVVRKWKTIDVRIIYGEGQTTEFFQVSTEKLTAGIIVAMVLGGLALVGAEVGLLISVFYCHYKQKSQDEEAKRKEDQQFMMEAIDPNEQ
ncbi:MAG: hypothetical protein EZS28_022835, partial [Streblomastix strix]